MLLEGLCRPAEGAVRASALPAEGAMRASALPADGAVRQCALLLPPENVSRTPALPPDGTLNVSVLPTSDAANASPLRAKGPESAYLMSKCCDVSLALGRGDAGVMTICTDICKRHQV